MSTTDTQPLAPAPAAPRPPRKWYRRPRNIALMSIAGLIAVGAISSAAGGSSHPAASASPQASTSAPAVPAPKAETPKATTPAAPVTPAPSLAERTSAWLEGPGGKATLNWATAATKLGDNPTDAQFAYLLEQGRIAVRYPCPVGTADYTAMFRHMNSGIEAYQAGDYTSALSDISDALTAAQAWQSAVETVTSSTTA